MSRQYYNDSYQSSTPRRVPASFYQPTNSSSRRQPSTSSRNFVSQSTFQPIQERHFVAPAPPPSRQYYGDYDHSDRYPNRMHTPSNDRPQRRYRLEPPSNHSYMQYPQSYENDYYHAQREQPQPQQWPPQFPSNRTTHRQTHAYDQDYSNYAGNTDHYDQNYYQPEYYPSQSYNLPSNHRASDSPRVRPNLYPDRSAHPPSLSSPSSSPFSSSPSSVPQQRVVVQQHHPVSLLAHILQNFLGDQRPVRDARLRNNYADNDDGDDDFGHAIISPINLIALGMMMQRPAIVHIQLGNLMGLLGEEETPVGLSEEDIKRIPKVTYKKSSKSKANDDKCAICLSNYKTGETLKRLRCDHFFHSDCIDPWLKTSVQCPICRGAQTN
ncbi:unnamed protein product [Adineta ricciae]|uniref:RING-type domain-containing protein n=1 Tax=Adineta ricciae TaxID=249248 RepID=A0A814FMP1_ADIRI|nr:unnamed protein product [Adineta ricciae]CAF0984870.1 unnamed protein product [Adineta ricciae]